jgi:hypothetical protein
MPKEVCECNAADYGLPSKAKEIARSKYSAIVEVKDLVEVII